MIRKQIYEFRLTGEKLAGKNNYYHVLENEHGRRERLGHNEFMVINNIGMSARKSRMVGGTECTAPYKAGMQVVINTTQFFCEPNGYNSAGPSNLIIPLEIKLKEFVSDDSVTYKIDADNIIKDDNDNVINEERSSFFKKTFKGGSVDFADWNWDIYVYDGMVFEFVIQFIEGTTLEPGEYIDVAIGYTFYDGSDATIADQLVRNMYIPATKKNVEWLKRRLLEQEMAEKENENNCGSECRPACCENSEKKLRKQRVIKSESGVTDSQKADL